MSSVDINTISQYTGTSSLLDRLNIGIASDLVWAKTALILILAKYISLKLCFLNSNPT